MIILTIYKQTRTIMLIKYQKCRIRKLTRQIFNSKNTYKCLDIHLKTVVN